jgi:hypothetical protein
MVIEIDSNPSAEITVDPMRGWNATCVWAPPLTGSGIAQPTDWTAHPQIWETKYR